MPLFFFDVDDGRRRIRDDTGMSLDDADRVEAEVERIVYDLAFGELLGGVSRRFTATVRDEAGQIVYRGTMTLDIVRP